MNPRQDVYPGTFKKGDTVRCVRSLEYDPHYNAHFTPGKLYAVYETSGQYSPPELVILDDAGEEIFANHYQVFEHFTLVESVPPKSKTEIVMEAFGFQSEAELEEFLKGGT